MLNESLIYLFFFDFSKSAPQCHLSYQFAIGLSISNPTYVVLNSSGCHSKISRSLLLHPLGHALFHDRRNQLLSLLTITASHSINLLSLRDDDATRPASDFFNLLIT